MLQHLGIGHLATNHTNAALLAWCGDVLEYFVDDEWCAIGHQLNLTQHQQAMLEALSVERVVGIKSEQSLPQPAPLVSGGKLIGSRPGELTLIPESAEVVVRESFSSGWRAWADGTPLTITAAPPIFMKVSVPKDAKRVVFRYEPLSWRVGVFLSGGAGCILVALMMVSLRKRVWRS